MNFESLLYKYKNTYYGFPQSLKTFLGSAYGTMPLSIRFGKNYTFHQNIIQKFEKSDEQYKLDFVYNKLLETLIFAEENISYYQNIFQEYGVSSKDFKSLEDIKRFPYLTKNDVKHNFKNLYSTKVDQAVTYYSGGSLSTPTKYYLPKSSSRAKEKAYVNYIFSKNGYQYRDKALLLKGREIANLNENTYWDYDPIDNFFFLSYNYFNSEVFLKMYEKAKKFEGKFLFGYPSAVLSFIKLIEKHGLRKINFQGVMLSSETVYPDELKTIQNYFNVDVLALYGHTERAVTGYKINSGSYKFSNSYGAPLIVNEEIVGTTFDNFVMPLINYKTGDHVTGKIEYFKNSDIAKTAENIEGRLKDYLVTEDNRLVSITTMCGGQHLPLNDIDALQYIQDKPGEVTVLVEGDADTEKVKEGIYKLVRDGIKFNVNKVDYIEKSSRGKRIMCKQELDIEKIRNDKI